jgi:predicted NBD/HSP70 family sugar kinase
MKQKVLALDLGGTSVKAGVFIEGNLEKTTIWEHDYRHCTIEKAKQDLMTKINAFCNYSINAVGIGVAGLIAKNNSLYRSTVLTSFTGFDIPEFLKQELGVEIETRNK